jgi:hypothetical protein
MGAGMGRKKSYQRMQGHHNDWTQRPRPEEVKPDRGRRLTPAQLAEAAAQMGLPVSEHRYEPEPLLSKAKREAAFIEARRKEKALMRSGPPKHTWLKNSGVKSRKIK